MRCNPSILSAPNGCERVEYDLLFRWFVCIGIDDAAWDHSVFSKSRDRLLDGDMAAKFLNAILSQPMVKRQLSNDPFSVDAVIAGSILPRRLLRKIHVAGQTAR
ncbi:transposase [Mesorhizobium abyssinicae]|uniref:transposase n=1 Tax=Mesorhizobium abyssinicae TaxID=1209958 RepID=UPI00387DCDCE